MRAGRIFSSKKASPFEEDAIKLGQSDAKAARTKSTGHGLDSIMDSLKYLWIELKYGPVSLVEKAFRPRPPIDSPGKRVHVPATDGEGSQVIERVVCLEGLTALGKVCVNWEPGTLSGRRVSVDVPCQASEGFPEI